MNGKARKSRITDTIGQRLREQLGGLTREPLPDRMVDLLRRMENRLEARPAWRDRND